MYNIVKKGVIMKRAVNLRLEESVIVTLNQLSEELHTTKTEVIEKAISLFLKQNNLKQNQLLQFAGKLKSNDADNMLQSIVDDKNSKDFELDL
jgi:predicted transcriptional regulator